MNYSLVIPIILTLGSIMAVSAAWVQYFEDRDNKVLADSLREKNEFQTQKLISKQEELQVKTEEIIDLQKQIKLGSDLQINDLKRLAQPIPKASQLTFTAELNITEKDFDDMMSDINASGVQTGNLLPTTFTTDKPIIHKLNQLKDILCSITAVVTNDNKKTITINRRVIPTYFGFNNPNGHTLDAFILSYNPEKDKKIFFHGQSINSTVEFSYDQGSFLDFKNSEVEISIEFSLPIILKFGAQTKKQYKSEPDFISLSLNEFRINFEGYPPIVLKKFTAIAPNRFYTTIKE